MQRLNLVGLRCHGTHQPEPYGGAALYIKSEARTTVLVALLDRVRVSAIRKLVVNRTKPDLVVLWPRSSERRLSAPADRVAGVLAPRRQVPKSLRNCAEVIELGDDAISYCLVRRDPPPPETINTALPPRSKTVLLPARGHPCSAGRLPRPLVVPLRSTSLGTRGAFARLRANDAMDRGIGRIPRVRGAHRAVLLPRAVGGTAWISLGRRGTFTPPKPPEASNPRLTRVPRPSSHARRAANVPGLRSSSPPVVRAAPTA